MDTLDDMFRLCASGSWGISLLSLALCLRSCSHACFSCLPSYVPLTRREQCQKACALQGREEGFLGEPKVVEANLIATIAAGLALLAWSRYIRVFIEQPSYLACASKMWSYM